MAITRLRPWLVARGFALAWLAAACAAPAPTEQPPGLGIDWARANPVERPAGFDFETEQPGSVGSGRSGHPYHFPGQAMLADIARVPAGGFVTVGYVYPGWHPGAWTSPDGTTWSAQPMGDTEFTFPVALAVRDSTVVAVGRSGARPMTWSSLDGSSWVERPAPTLGDGEVAERITTVISTPDGFLAGGSAGPELADRHARFWRSADGVTWQPVADEPAAFAAAEVRSIVRLGAGYVAVGIAGGAQAATGSVAWRSPDGASWTRIDDPELAKGRAVAIVEAPFGGLVAVGSDLDEGEALVWLSADGRSWHLAPSEASRRYPGRIRMTDVTAVGNQLIAVGNFVGVQYGTAAGWASTDGLHWQRSVDAPGLQQGELYAVIPGGPGVIAVGSFGAPDNYVPTVWLSPAREPLPSISP